MIGQLDQHKVKKTTAFLIYNQYSSDTKLIANHFNEYFIKVGSSLVKNIKTNIDPLQYVYYNKYTINIPEINIHEIKSVISSLPDSAAGYGEIPASLMKQLVNYYAEPLRHLISQSISQGLFHEEMKIAKILPIYKSEVANYRPISMFTIVFLKYLKKKYLNIS